MSVYNWSETSGDLTILLRRRTVKNTIFILRLKPNGFHVIWSHCNSNVSKKKKVWEKEKAMKITLRVRMFLLIQIYTSLRNSKAFPYLNGQAKNSPCAFQRLGRKECYECINSISVLEKVTYQFIAVNQLVYILAGSQALPIFSYKNLVGYICVVFWSFFFF